MSLVHEPNTRITYIICGKYAQTVYDMLKKQDAGCGDDIGDIMIKTFDGTYYNFDPGTVVNSNEVCRRGERIEEFSMTAEGNLEIILDYYDVGKEFPFFLLWHFPDVEIKMYSLSKGDVWWWSCAETVVTTNDFEGAKAMGLDSESYYANLVACFQKESPKNIRNEKGEWLVCSECDGKGNETWVPLRDCYRYQMNVIKLERPSEAPKPQSIMNPISDCPSTSQTEVRDEDNKEGTDNDLPF